MTGKRLTYYKGRHKKIRGTYITTKEQKNMLLIVLFIISELISEVMIH